jgi:hypothetical protein
VSEQEAAEGEAAAEAAEAPAGCKRKTRTPHNDVGNYNFHLNYSYVLKHHEFYQTYLLYQKPPENKSVWPTKSHEIDLVLLPT